MSAVGTPPLHLCLSKDRIQGSLSNPQYTWGSGSPVPVTMSPSGAQPSGAISSLPQPRTGGLWGYPGKAERCQKDDQMHPLTCCDGAQQPLVAVPDSRCVGGQRGRTLAFRLRRQHANKNVNPNLQRLPGLLGAAPGASWFPSWFWKV